MTPSEKFVAELCRQSFLPLWSFPNPIGKKGKELCDVLIVCGNYIVIISVKDIAVTDHSDENIQYERWRKKAIDASVEQIYGAERYLATVTEVIAQDRKTKIKLPTISDRIVYRIAVAFGSKKEFPLPIGDFGKGFTHVFDEQSTLIVFKELDTVKDFTDYLAAKEMFFNGKQILLPSEVDFLGVYLQTGLEFDYEVDTFVCDSDVWSGYVDSKEYRQWRKDIEPSYIWDELIGTVHRHQINEQASEKRIHQMEQALRLINLEPRINRIELASVLTDAMKKKVSRRMIRPLKGSRHTYVFIPLTEKNWNAKESELGLCCAIARVENPEAHTVIGISIGRAPSGEMMFDIHYLHLPEINNEFVTRARIVQQELGYFKKPVVSHSKDFR